MQQEAHQAQVAELEEQLRQLKQSVEHQEVSHSLSLSLHITRDTSQNQAGSRTRARPRPRTPNPPTS